MEKENVNKTKEKMIKECKKIGEILHFVFWLTIIMLIISLIFSVIIAIFIACKGASKTEIIDTIMLPFSNLLNIKTNFGDITAIKETILKVVIHILSLNIWHALSKMLLNASKDETPFSLVNIKNMKRISISLSIIILAIVISSEYTFNSLCLLSLFTINGIDYIFRYGYKLQQESDETL